MTQFEVDRMKAAFEYLEDQELYHLEEIKRSNNPRCREACAEVRRK